jgi:hypothetical protein
VLDSEKMAIAAHLHVLLRRLVGRVTDVEWMVRNRDYAMEVTRVALAEPHPELHAWAAKLQAALHQPPVQEAPAPLRAPPRTDTVPEARDSRFGFAATQPPKRYVRSLR